MFRTAAAVAVCLAGTAVAAPPPELAAVPPDAAVFVHADIAKIWASKIGDTLRKSTAKDIGYLVGKFDASATPSGGPGKEIEAFFKQFYDATGLTLADVKSVTLWFPRLENSKQAFALTVRMAKPYPRAGVVEFLRGQAKREKVTVTEKPNGRYLIGDESEVDLTDPTAIRYASNAGKKDFFAPATGTGPLAPVIAEAAAGKPLVFGVTLASLPDEVRGDNLPPSFAPFKPLLLSDAGRVVGDMVGGSLTLDVRFAAGTKAKAVEAEKSLGALKAVIVAGVEAQLRQGERELASEKNMMPKKDMPAKPTADESPTAGVLAFGRAMVERFKRTEVGSDGATATATLSVPLDTDFGPLLNAVFGRTEMASARAVSSNNLKQLGLAMHNYESSYQTFPPAAILGKKGKPNLSWRVSVLPFVEHDVLYRKFKLDEAWDSPHNKKVFDENPMPAVFLLPGTAADAGKKKQTHYQVFVGNGAMFDLVQGQRIAGITDGTSNTLMLAVAKTPVEWTKPDDIPFDPKGDPREKLRAERDTFLVALADGSVRAVSSKLSAENWRALVTRSGGEIFSFE